MREQNSQNKQCRIPCLPFLSFLRILLALLKINGAANKSEFLVQPYTWNGGADDTRSEFSSAQTITMRHALDKGTLEIQILLSIHS